LQVIFPSSLECEERFWFHCLLIKRIGASNSLINIAEYFMARFVHNGEPGIENWRPCHRSFNLESQRLASWYLDLKVVHVTRIADSAFNEGWESYL